MLSSYSTLSSSLPESLIDKFPKTKKNTIRLFRGKGCPVCQETGYLGRIGIFEILEISEPIKKLVMEKANASKITLPKDSSITEGATRRRACRKTFSISFLKLF